MNFLPLIFGLLIVLTLSNQAILTNRLDGRYINNSHLGNIKADRDANNNIEETIYKKIKTEVDRPKKEDPVKKQKPVNSKQLNRVVKNEQKECARINLFPLIEAEKPQEKKEYEILLKLINILYAKHPFFNKTRINDPSSQILDSLILSAKLQWDNSSDEPFYLEKLSLKDASLQMIFYKMLKGSKGYDLAKKIGYPSFLDFVTIDSKTKTTKICLSHASKELLSSIYNEKIANDLFKVLEQARYITSDKLLAVLSQNGVLIDTKTQELLAFSHKSSGPLNKIIVNGEDGETKTQVRKTVYIESAP